MPWKQQAVSWLQEHIHWLSQWVIFCPFLQIASAKKETDRDSAQDRFLTKFLFSMLIQVATGVVSVTAGSYITLQIIGYRMNLAEEAIKSQAAKHSALAEAQAAQQRSADERLARHEAELAKIQERNRITELLDDHRRATERK